MSNRAERRRAEREMKKYDKTGRFPTSHAALNDLKVQAQAERLVAVALIDAEGVTHQGGQSHYELRSRLGRSNPSAQDPRDTPGFWTSFDRFVTRDEAQVIGEESGQCRPQRRELLSSDVDW